MAGSTARYVFPYPSALDATNPPGDIQSLAQAIDNFLNTVFGIVNGTGEVNLTDHLLRRPLLRDVSEVISTLNPAGATPAFDYEVASVFDLTLDQNVTIPAPANPPASGVLGSLLVIVRQPGALKTVTWNTAYKFPSAVQPSMVINSVNIFPFVTVTGGSAWRSAGLDVR